MSSLIRQALSSSFNGSITPNPALVFCFNFESDYQDQGPYNFFVDSWGGVMPSSPTGYMDLTGTTTRASIVSSTYNTPVNSLSWAFDGFFEFNDFNGSYGGILSGFGPSNSGITVWWETYSPTTARIYVYDGGLRYSTATVPLNTKVYVGVSKVGTSITFNINGSINVVSGVVENVGAGSISSFTLGADNRSDAYFCKALIHSCRLYVGDDIDVSQIPSEPLSIT